MKTFQLPIFVTAVKTMSDKGLEIKIHTRDIKYFPPEQLASLMAMLDKEYWAAFKETEIKPEEIEVGEERVDKGQKTAAQRLRAVIYRLWEQTGKSEDSETHYQRIIEGIINQIKDKLE